MTFDNRLFIWRYDDERDFTVWDGLDQIIVSVGLVRPKPGVFAESVRHLLIVTTPVEVVVLAVSFGPDGSGEMQLLPTALAVPTDDVNMLQVGLLKRNFQAHDSLSNKYSFTQICGTPLGRVFMCGNDGNLYELEYQAPGGWFSKKCRKRNHTQGLWSSYLPFITRLYSCDAITELRFDGTRNILYALTASSAIHGYYLGADGRSFSHFVTRTDLGNDPNIRGRLHFAAGTELKIASIWPITAPESSRLHLVAVTTTGARLFFTTTPGTSDKPYALQIQHVDHPVKVRVVLFLFFVCY